MGAHMIFQMVLIWKYFWANITPRCFQNCSWSMYGLDMSLHNVFAGKAFRVNIAKSSFNFRRFIMMSFYVTFQIIFCFKDSPMLSLQSFTNSLNVWFEILTMVLSLSKAVPVLFSSFKNIFLSTFFLNFNAFLLFYFWPMHPFYFVHALIYVFLRQLHLLAPDHLAYS